jgi:hypothetical protein
MVIRPETNEAESRGFVRIERVEPEAWESSSAAETIKILVELQGAFRGAAFQWLTVEGLVGFLRQLEQLERKRTGSVRLLSDTGEFELTIRARDRAGHMACVGVLDDYYLEPWAFGLDLPGSRVVAAFEIDPTMLPG